MVTIYYRYNKYIYRREPCSCNKYIYRRELCSCKDLCVVFW